MGDWHPEILSDGQEMPWVSRNPVTPKPVEGCRCAGELERLHCSRGLCGNAVVRAPLQHELRVVWMGEGKGAGLIAENYIPSGQFVIEYVGEVLTELEADRREDVYEKHKIFYMLDVENEDCAQYTIDTALMGNAARFVNHSCSPNLVAYDVYEQPGCPPRIIFVTLRDISKGEELCINYHPNQSPPDTVRQLCACGSENCSGWVF
eukprot:TRINITY_DN47723_c0_g1_i1.p1 TRINITY_DN47723_c0_g1~~TRINITY_DN47723_c0_g1_i1.p1  ORF type:complete len:206 (+),score=35.66 TRINITY_DN47723_c0_g1_i1:103-720(+)